MMRARLDTRAYPRKGLFRFDRVAEDGEILHPYAGRKHSDCWVICLYRPFTQAWTEMAESVFMALPIATPVDIKKRSERNPPAARIDL